MRALDAFRNRFPGRWPTASLRSWLLALILVGTGPMAALLSLQLLGELRSEQESVDEDLSGSAAALAQALERELDSSLDALAALARSDVLQRGQMARLPELLAWRPRRDWDSIFVLAAADGATLFDTAPAAPSQPGLRELHQQIVQAGEAAVASLPLPHARATRTVVVAVPVLAEGALHYVLGARLRESIWQQLADTANAPAGAQASLVDAKGQMLIGSPDSAGAGRLPRDAAAAMRQPRTGIHRIAAGGQAPVYAAWHAVPNTSWHVYMALPALPIEAARRRAWIAALAVAGAGLLAGLLLAALAARRVTAPLHLLATRGPAVLPGRVAVREVALLRDALSRAQAQDAAAHDTLQAKAQEFQTLFNSSPIGMAFAQDPGCRTIWQNAAMDALIGPAGAHRAGSVRVLHDGRVLAPGQQPLQRAAALGETTTGLELEIAIDGRAGTFVIANAVPLRDAAGRPRGAISALVDITERKRVEARLLATDAQLRESQRLMDLAQEAGDVGFFHYQFAGDRLAWTPGQCKLFRIGESPGALQQWWDRIEPADRDRVEREFWTACALRRENQTLEYCVVVPEGSRWLSSRVLLRYDDDGRPEQMIGVTVDMTDQKQSERAHAQLTERALAARREAEAASRAKDEFLTMLSHELRNPLGAISAAVDVLEAAQSDHPNAIEARSIIGRQTRNLAHMMNDLLDVGRVIAGKILLARGSVNLADVVQRVHRMLEITAEAKNHRLTAEVADVWVDGDAVRLEQVVTNLLNNALKYTPHGASVEVRLAASGGSAVLEVLDSGIGIPPALLPRIFNLFVQGERPLHRPAGGLGIGLTLVRRLVELHGGTVSADSSNTGSRFTVRLPAVAAPSCLAHPDALPVSRRRKVLVIDDNRDVLAALRSKLELDGHSVSTAADGVEGLSRLLSLRPEVSIVDIGLPGLTGFELARHARAAGYAGRMIALSGYGADRDARAALVAGFDAYLVKPVDRNDLRASLSAD